jgi:hypothetical protein
VHLTWELGLSYACCSGLGSGQRIKDKVLGLQLLCAHLFDNDVYCRVALQVPDSRG